MKQKLSDALAQEWQQVAEAEKGGKEGFEVVVSTKDSDPYEIV